MQVLCGLQGIFLIFNCQTPEKEFDFLLQEKGNIMYNKRKRSKDHEKIYWS